MGSESQSIPIKYTADGTSIDLSNKKFSVKDDGITKAKLNADIVGIDTASGKVNDINATNFKDLDGSDLTDVGSWNLIETITLGSAGDTFAFTSIPTGYKMLKMYFSGTSVYAGTSTVSFIVDAQTSNYHQEITSWDGATTNASSASGAVASWTLGTVTQNQGMSGEATINQSTLAHKIQSDFFSSADQMFKRMGYVAYSTEITSITVSGTGNFGVGSRVILMGLK